MFLSKYLSPKKLLGRPPTTVRHGLKPYAAASPLDAAAHQPSQEVLALRNIKRFQSTASIDHGFDPDAGHSYAAAHGELLELEQMEPDAAQ